MYVYKKCIEVEKFKTPLSVYTYRTLDIHVPVSSSSTVK